MRTADTRVRLGTCVGRTVAARTTDLPGTLRHETEQHRFNVGSRRMHYAPGREMATMTLTTRAAATVLVCLVAAGCGNGGKIETSPLGDYQTESPVGDSPVSPPQPATAGTVVVLDYEYSYTPIGATPTPFRGYTPGQIVHIAVGTSILVELSEFRDPRSSDPTVILPVRPPQDAVGHRVTVFRAARAGTASVTAARASSCYGTLPCSRRSTSNSRSPKALLRSAATRAHRVARSDVTAVLAAEVEAADAGESTIVRRSRYTAMPTTTTPRAFIGAIGRMVWS